MVALAVLYEKAKSSPNNYSFEDLCLLVQKIGFEFARQSGSHHIYRHSGLGRDGMVNIQNVKGKAKPYQVKQILSLIEHYKLVP
jgi:predicted RNA binding protein YcfA (HicA-like mRNA interferase family)